MRYLLISIWVSLIFNNGHAQSIIENSNLKLVNMPMSSRENYLGKAAICTFEPDIAIALANPALIQYNTKHQLLTSSALYFGSNYINASYSLNNETFDIPFVIGANIMSYGKQRYVDVNGNDLGAFHPTEASMYVALSKTYLHYNFGFSSKLVYGNYYLASTLGLTTDWSMLYRDVEREIYISLLVKNVGFQFLNNNTRAGTFPFDIRLGISKKLEHLPFRFTVVAQELYHWTTSTTSADYDLYPLSQYYTLDTPDFFKSLLSHFVFSGEFYLGEHIKFGLGLDLKKAQEDKFDAFRGLTGLSLGFGIYGRKYQAGYSFSKFSPISASHQFTLGLNFDAWLRKR